jgi:hypothetical protein
MASGDTLATFTALSAEFPTSNYATPDIRNNHSVLDFDTTTGETVYFTGIMPRNYAGGGVTVYLHWAASSATSGTIGWLVAFERMGDGGTDIDADSFASDATVTAETVDGTSGIMDVSNAAIANGADMDSVVAGDTFRLRVTRDVANDTATGDAELISIEIKET